MALALPRRMGWKGKEKLRVNMTETRVEKLYKSLKKKISHKREMWSASHLSVFHEEGWENKPLILRRAKAIELQLTHMPVEIEEGELIIGCIPLGNMWFGIPFPAYATDEEIHEAEKYGIGVRSVWGHYVPNFSRILKQGLRGVRAQAGEKLKTLEGDPDKEKKKDFLESVILTTEAVRKLATRYQVLAASLAQKEPNFSRREELEQISMRLGHVPEEPALDFKEAIQSFWFAFLVLHSTMNNIPIGRLDYFLWPFLKADLERGKTTLAEAQEWVDCLWLKFNERSMFVEPEVESNDFIMVKQSQLVKKHMGLYNHWLQNLMVGGQDSEGNDATNELTYLCLEASRKFDFTQPVISARLHAKTPEKLLGLACQLIQTGAGMPSIYNDPVLISALERNGFPLEKARGYSNDGCWEVLIPGEAEFRWGPVHALQCLEFVFTDGKSRVLTDQDKPTLFIPVKGIETGDPTAFTSYEELWRAFLRQMEYQIESYMAQTRLMFGKYQMIVPVPFLSSLIEGCLENGRDVTNGGARYYLNAMMLTGLANTADSLAAIRKLVFQGKKISLRELFAAIENDFEGKEKLRQLLINRSPKYGNDKDEVDGIAGEIVSHFRNKIVSLRNNYLPIKFIPGIGTFEDYDLFGKMVGATPDGRKAWTALAPNAGPVPGMDMNGPTALLHSYNKLENSFLAAGAELDISMNAQDFKGEEGLHRLMGFVKAFLKTEGTVLNIALNDVEILKRAQLYPEQYKDLRVRVGGWSAYFVLLDKRNQDHQIARYSHR
jgi:pyruvate-formate lyase